MNSSFYRNLKECLDITKFSPSAKLCSKLYSNTKYNIGLKYRTEFTCEHSLRTFVTMDKNKTILSEYITAETLPEKRMHGKYTVRQTCTICCVLMACFNINSRMESMTLFGNTLFLWRIYIHEDGFKSLSADFPERLYCIMKKYSHWTQMGTIPVKIPTPNGYCRTRHHLRFPMCNGLFTCTGDGYGFGSVWGD